MKLGVQEAIDEIQTHIHDLNNVIYAYNHIITKLENINGDDSEIKTQLNEAGFTDEQIKQFVKIIFSK